MENSFINASRKFLRFESSRNQGLTVEDLWILSLKSLDEMGQAIVSKLNKTGSSLLENPDKKISVEQHDNELRLDIIKTIIGIKQEENKANATAASNRRRKEILEELLEQKKMGELAGKTIEEIQAEIASL